MIMQVQKRKRKKERKKKRKNIREKRQRSEKLHTSIKKSKVCLYHEK